MTTEAPQQAVDPMQPGTAVAAKPGQARVEAASPSNKAAVGALVREIEADKAHYDKDYRRMRDNMEFASGLQRPGQATIDSEEYICNLVIRTINQKVAALYAHNPKAEWERRERMDFQLWDERMESIEPLVLKGAQGIPLMMSEMAVIQDYMSGMQFKQLVEKVGRTLKILYQYQIDEHDPNFKLQAKQLVRRVATTGVGYVRVSFSRDVDCSFTSDGLDNNLPTRFKEAKSLMEQVDESGMDESDPRLEQVRLLLEPLAASFTGQGQETKLTVDEKLVFDFLPSTAVIPDRNCRMLKGFVGARRLTIEYVLPLSEVNAYFEVDLKPDATVNRRNNLDDQGREIPLTSWAQGNTDKDTDPPVVFWEVLDKRTKTRCFVTEGYDTYLMDPEPMEPAVKGFWPVFTLTFNDIEAEAGGRTSIFPPSDVQLIKHPQKEWNRMRQELRGHRIANSPKYPIYEGTLDEKDYGRLTDAPPNSVVLIKNTGSNLPPSELCKPLQHALIDPAVYDTSQALFDILNSVGMQDANIGQPSPDATATGQTIAEQSRMSGIGSNIDDLDDFLGELARAGGDISLQSFSQQVVMEIVGPGAVWPTDNREEFLKEVFLKVVAASSGRPNKAIEIANWERLLPFLMQMGANPQALVRETIKRADDRIEPESMFPLMPQAVAQPPQGQSGGKQPSGQVRQQGRPGPGKTGPQAQPLQQLPSGQAMPMVGAQ